MLIKLFYWYLYVRALLGCAWAFLCGLWSKAPLAESKSLDAPFFTKLLREKGVIDDECRVVTASIVPLDNNRGFAGAMNKIQLDLFQNGEKTVDDDNLYTSSLTLVLKRSMTGVQGRTNVLFGEGFRNALFYNSTLGKKVQQANLIELPLYANGSFSRGEFVLVMQDLNRLPDAVPFNKVMGDQIFGSGCADKALRRRHMEKLFRDIAKMHAQFWCDESLMQHTWLKGVQQRAGTLHGKLTYVGALQFVRRYWQQGLVRAANTPDFRLDPRLKKLIDTTLGNASWANAHKYFQTARFSLTHGDFHASNMFVFGKNGDFRLVDWTEVGLMEPAVDVAQCVISDLHHSDFEKTVPPLIDIYHRALLDNGVPDYSLKECRADFHRLAIEKWLYFVPLLLGWDAIPIQLNQYFHDQLLNYVELFGDFNGKYNMANLCYVVL